MLLQMKSTNEAGRDNPGKSWQIVASNRLEQFRTCWNSLYQPQFAATLRDARRRSITQALRQPALHGIGWAKARSLRSAAPGFCPFEAPPGFEHACDRPRLRRTAARGVRRITVEDLANLAEPGIEQMIADRPQQTLRLRGVAVDTIMGERVMAEQPRPYRALMIPAVALDDPALVAAMIVGIVGRQRAQSIGGQESIRAAVQHGALRWLIQRARPQAHRQDLVRPEPCVRAARTVDD